MALEKDDGRLVPSKHFLLAAGCAGVVAGVITLAIVILPYIYDRPADFVERLALHNNAFYILGLWLSYLNIFAILLAGLGVAAHRFRYSPGAALAGMLFLLFYGATELIGRSVMIFTREFRWVRGALDAEGEAKAALLDLVRTFDQVWAGAFPLILMTFSLSAVLFAWAMRGGKGLQRVTCVMLFAAAALGGITFLAQYLPAFRPIASWGYILIQPTSRFLIGLYLLGAAASVPVGSSPRGAAIK